MIKRALKKVIPPSQRFALRASFNKIKYFGFSRYCPICKGHFRKFLPGGVRMRPDAVCPACGSRERHRLVWTFFVNHTDLFSPGKKRMLHIAPVKSFSRMFKEQENLDYLTADLHDPSVMVKMDITGIQYPDDRFDVIYCSHVLEHVPEDRKAMRELHRVLAPGGWAVLQVPITAEETFGDPSVTDPKERERLFGQYNHVRRYGPDYEDRLEEAGFAVRKYRAADVVGTGNIERLGIMEEDVYYCTKPNTSSPQRRSG